MSRGQWSILLSLLGAFILVVAACAPAVTPTPTATPTPPPVVATPTPVAGMPVGYGYSEFGEWGMPLNLPPPQYGGILREGSSRTPGMFDAHRSLSYSVLVYTGVIRDGLVRFSPYLDVELIPGTYDLTYLSPNLAEKWEVSQDSLMVTFYLKRGVKWHDGAPFTAKDVKYSLEKLTDRARSTFSADMAMVDRVEKVDDYTVKVYLKYPAARFFLLNLGLNQMDMQAEHLKDVSYRTTAFLVGTGPFKFVSYTAGIEYATTKNPDYHFKGRPYYDGYKYYFFATADAHATALAAGQLDFDEDIGAEAAEELLRKAAPEVVYRTHKKLNVMLNLAFSYARPGPWQDVRVRRAVAMVLDRDLLCEAAYGSKQAGRICNSQAGYFVSAPEGWGLPWSEYERAWGLDKPMEVRIAAARKLLAEAGYPNGFELSWGMSAQPAEQTLVNMDMLQKALNIKVNPRIVPAAQMRELQLKGEFEVVSADSTAFTGAMEQWVSSSYLVGSMSNFNRYSHPLVAELYVKLIKEPDFNKGLDIFHQIERLLIADVAQVPQYAGGDSLAIWPYVTPHRFAHPVWHSNTNGRWTVSWFDRNHPSWAKRAK